ncbi:thioredoxin family protein [Rhizobium sp. 32-5/1]|uniref:DUF1223 domain-containing protein n=1 Tax=Rhizobium sp. 32-5/1 TaxID=3019602 RepID=UPI00240DB920|nr:thioredoxin family protein [Rhizobium sp. 32-5/1]WEZ85075.1 thioredoxin family protein [Rhizobium sp. 32-5/1]
MALGFGVTASLPAFADDVSPTGVVELFTSQGCSSCPPADAALKRLVEEGKVVALSYHVDYWNYLGWQDTLGSKENTARQYAYAKALGRNGVYTPQAVINGRDHVNGSDLAGIKTRVETMAAGGEGLTVKIGARIGREEIDIDVGAGEGKADVVVVYFNRRQTVDIEKGENSGKRVDYWHAVRDVQTIGMWNGKASKFVLPASVLKQGESGGCAILLQTVEDGQKPRAILGATTILAGDTAN